MEQKTIGKFISALRKAEGMTQKDLAEKLNVSDKSVSRWERDDGAPDISLIPVIAEIFGVTCDELLRGERKPAAERAEVPSEEKNIKAEKQLKRLIKLTLFRFKSQSYIAMAIAAVGFIAALIANLGFTKALLGFFLALAFIVAALVCEIIFINRAFFSVEDAELEVEEVSDFKRKVVKLAEIAIGFILILLAFLFPLLSVDAYLGLAAESMILYGGIFAGAFLLVYMVVLYFLNASFMAKGIFLLSEKEMTVYNYRHKLKIRVGLSLLSVVLITLLVHYSCTILDGPGSVMKGTTFDDYESFITYMEEDIPQSPRYGQDVAVGVDVLAEPIEEIYYDMDGNVLTEEEVRRRVLTDIDGNVVCEYIQRNENVRSVSYSPKEGTILPITVKTYDELYQAEILIASRHRVFIVVYIFEIIAALGVYFALRNRKPRKQ